MEVVPRWCTGGAELQMCRPGVQRLEVQQRRLLCSRDNSFVGAEVLQVQQRCMLGADAAVQSACRYVGAEVQIWRC